MANENAKRDENKVPTQVGVSPLGEIRRRKYSDRGGAYSRFDPCEQYGSWRGTVEGNTDWDTPEHIDIGEDLKGKYGYSLGVPAASLFIISDSDIQLKFNAEDGDEVRMDVTLWGNTFEIGGGELAVYDIYIANYIPSGAAPDASVEIFWTG